VAAGALAVAALVAGLALGGGGDEEGGGSGDKQAAAEEPGPAGEKTPATPKGSGNAPADGATLNDQGFALINEGDYEGAIPVLERAVQSLEGSGDELTYNYALYNLGHALRLAGRPDEAIPVLEQRLAYPDQQETVAAELDAARADAGLSEGDED
jgi:serine/threonine-protein kinase